MPSPRGTVPSVPGLPTGMREGDVVAGKYRIIKVLGAGAMGTVVLAHHLNLDQKVAIKFLVPEALGQADAIARFVREARAAARIRSEHVVRVHDVNLLESGVPYIEMEYLEGCDLAAWLHSYGPLPVQTAVDFVLQACVAIAEAHELGIIHRDLKPANLFAAQRDGAVEIIKVLDFGISKAAGLVSSTVSPSAWHAGAVITEEKTPIGSPCYMSPEQMESARDVDARTDVWALGVTLCELVTGRLPYDGQSLIQVYSKIRSGAPLRLREGAPDLPPELEAVILRCLDVDREARYPDVGSLAAALVDFGSPGAAVYVERMRRSDRRDAGRADSGAPDSFRSLTPSPRVLPVPRVDATLASPVLAAARRARAPSGVVLVAVVCLVLAATAAVLRLLSRTAPGAPAAVSVPSGAVSPRSATQAATKTTGAADEGLQRSTGAT
ncbi:MAG TPA: serine/threonine-protein kinase, partial [Polyangiaceae bacterium]|nr:serine/threonine-protein kinase [Polyangiaceae bacterium]